MAEASISCDPGDGVPTELTLASYDDADELRSAFAEEASTIDSSLETLDDACQDGTAGSRKWGFGTIACLTGEDAAVVLWTDQRSKVLGRLGGDVADLADVFGWWHENARALGRPVETTPEATPKPAITRPFKRVPGDPRAISCSAISDPIPDVHGRLWAVDKIEFLGRGDYERVIIHLDQVGSNRNVRTTQVVVERMPVSDLSQAVPNAPKPRRGKTAIVVNLEGVRQAPNLRSYRPSATNIVKEFSLVRDGRSRSAVISTSRGTCYQVRVPVFGSSASGKERNAEVYIDLK